MRTMVAIEALCMVSIIIFRPDAFVSQLICPQKHPDRRHVVFGPLALAFGDTHIAPNAKIAITAVFSLPLICKDHTSEIGRVAYIKSPAQLIAEYPYVAATTIEVSRQLPVPLVYRVQKYSVGMHWNTNMKKKKALYSSVITKVTHKMRLCKGRTLSRSNIRAMLALMAILART